MVSQAGSGPSWKISRRVGKFLWENKTEFYRRATSDRNLASPEELLLFTKYIFDPIQHLFNSRKYLIPKSDRQIYQRVENICSR